VLDIFAGSGSLGFEALSRGAASAVFIEQNPKAAKIISENQRALKVEDRSRVLIQSAEVFWKNPEKGEGLVKEWGPFDFIFADPPYEFGWESKLLENMPWELLLAKDGQFIVEWSDRNVELPDTIACLRKTRERDYGQTWLTSYVRE